MKVKFTPESVSSAVSTLLIANAERYLDTRLKVIKDNYTPVLKFIVSSAVTNRFSPWSPRVNSNTSNDSEAITKALALICKFNENEYKKQSLVLQHFVWFAASHHNLPVTRPSTLVGLGVFDKEELVEILLDAGCELSASIPKVSKPKCPMCGVNHTDDSDVCSDCYQKLLSTINFRVEDFKLYGTALENFSTQVKNFRVDVIDKLFTFTRTPYTESFYEPMLPFEEYQNDLAIV